MSRDRPAAGVQLDCGVQRVHGTADAAVDVIDQRPIDVVAILRYSGIFAAIVAPANLVILGFPASLVAIWLIARLIARKYRRQITVRETLYLALASWALSIVVRAAVSGPAIGPQLAFWLLELVIVWTAYFWLGRFVIGRNIVVRPNDTENRSASFILAQQKERYADAMARSFTLTFGWLMVGSLGMLLVIVLAVIVAIALALLGLGDISQAAVQIAVPVGMLALLGGWTYYIQRKTAEVFPSHRLVLWLRRFHQADLMEFPFPVFLERLCRGIAVPITLQDSSVTGATAAAQLRPAYHALRLLLVVAGFGLLFSSMAVLRSETWRDPEAAIAGVGVLVSVAVLSAVAFAIKRLGVVRLGTSRGRLLAERLMSAIDSKAGVPQTLTVVSTPDESWQAWVLSFIERADAVVIDVTHLSANLHWELRTLADHLLPEQLVLAYGQCEGEEQAIPRQIESELASILGSRMLEHSHRFFYKIPHPRWWRRVRSVRKEQRGWLRPSKAMTKIYSQRLAEALINAFSASDRVRKRETGIALTAEVSAGQA